MHNELRHHGIKGQKWGVRNGPPYPLKESKKSSREKKLHRAMGRSIGGMSNYNKDKLKAAAATILSGAALYGAMYLGYRYKVSLERAAHLAITSPISQIKFPHSEKLDMAAVNVGWYTGEPQYRMNCSMCTTAYELRRRGYDVKAQTSRAGRSESDIASWWKGTTKKDFTKTRKISDLKAKLSEQPDGSRGNIITGVGPYDSKHSMVWEKVAGKIIIRDCQSDTTYDDIDSSIIRQKSRHGYQILRTDNREINWETVRDAVMPLHEKG